MRTRISRRTKLIASMAGSCLSLAGAASAQVQFRHAPDLAPMAMSDELISQQLTTLKGKHVVVQFESTPTEAQRAAINASGLSLLAPLGNHAYFAKISDAGVAQGRAAAAMTPVSVRPIATDWKISQLMADGKIPTWAVIPGGTEADPMIGAYVALHDDQGIDNDAQAMVAAVGGTVRDVMLSINGMVIELPLSAARRLATDDRVMWIEPALPKMSPVNAENRALTGADLAQSPPYGLNGAGVTAFVYDGGTARSTHVDFQGRLTVLDNSGMIDHATHVSGTIGGAGVGVANNRGMAPGVTLLSAGLEVSSTGQFLYNNPGDIEADYATAIGLGADVANNSIGTNTESNGYACAMQGYYGLTDKLIDQIAKGSAGGPIIICWAAGNERQGSRCNVEGFGQYYSVAPPSGAKNHIPVGAVNANDDSMTSFSSWGPMDDGRLVPVISAPGCQVGGDGGVTSSIATSDTAYGVFCGTSMATPTVTGLVSLLLQDYRAHYPGQPDPVGSMVKAMLAHSAVDRGNVGPDYQFGYGSVRIIPTIDQMRTGKFLTGQAKQGSRTRYKVAVTPGMFPLKFTLAWDDVAATPNVAKTLVNDLDLVVYDPSGQPSRAWTLDPANPSAAAVRTTENHRDNIEQVVVDSGTPGDWYVEVRGYDVPQGPQNFSLVGLSPASSMTSSSIRITSTPAQPTAPGKTVPINATIALVNDTLQSPPTLFYRYQTSGAFASVPMTVVSGNDYTATIPAPRCGETMQYYASMSTTQNGSFNSGQVSDPYAGASGPYSRVVGSTTTVVSDNFNTNTGWAESSSPQLTSALGKWDRGTPVPNLVRGEPTSDADASGQCWLTGNVSNGDVDGGPTILTSPVFNLSGYANPIVSFSQWMYTSVEDVMLVQISTDGGTTWPTTLETVINGMRTWESVSFPVPNSDKFRIRFSVSDNPNDSVAEAGLDAFKITGVTCSYSCPADIDRSGDVDLSDFFAFFNAWDIGGADADVDGVPGVDLGDFFAFFNSFDVGCPA